MSKFKDITNQIFGRLRVVNRAPNNKHGQVRWNCVCDCGNERVVIGSKLKSGHTKSCGCYKRDATIKAILKDIKGQKFNRLLVVNKAPNKRGRVYWNCVCDCGNKVTLVSSSIRTGRTKSCGCLQKELLSKNTLKDLSGEKFDRLLVVDRAPNNEHGKACWNCVCDCGTKTICIGGHLISGGSKSCGCTSRGSQTHGTVYGIYDKDSNLIYIGKTIHYNIENRLKKHIESATVDESNNKMKVWLRSINYKPTIKPLVENILIEYLDKMEKTLIKSISKECRLLNTIHNKFETI